MVPLSVLPEQVQIDDFRVGLARLEDGFMKTELGRGDAGVITR